MCSSILIKCLVSSISSTPYDSQSKRHRSSIAKPVSTAEMVERSFVPYCMITTLGANSSTTPKSYSLVLETVLPPIPCHLMSRSPSRLKFFAMRALKLRQRKSCTRRMKEWPRIKTRDWRHEEKRI